MKLLGLTTLLESLFKSKPTPTSWGIKAKHHFPKPKPAKPANSAKKKRRQMVQASKRRNRR